jgi:predicted nucleic acid-binding protein
LLFDSNVYLSFLLSPDPESTAVALILNAAALGLVDLILPTDVIVEMNDVAARRRHATPGLDPERLNRLVRQIVEFATVVPLLAKEPRPISRDANDDFLIALALLHEVGYLVTRDRDLLVLGEVDAVKIVDPAMFLQIVRGGRH